MLALLLAAPLALVLSAVAAWLPIGQVRVQSRVPAAGAWLAAAALVALWLPSGTTREAALGDLAPGLRLALRLDPVVSVFGLISVLSVALLLTVRGSRRNEAAFTALACAAALVGLEASSLALAALVWSATSTLLLLGPRHDTGDAVVRFWATSVGGTLALLLAAGFMQAVGGTSDYTALPVPALSSGTFLLIAIPALWFSACVPTRSWLHDVWSSAGPITGSLFGAVMLPIGLYLLVRCYEVGAGRWPRLALNVVVMAVAALALAGAAYRAQRASALPGYAIEVMPLTSGLAVLAVGTGTSLGVVAGALALAGLVVQIPLLPAVAFGRSRLVGLGLAVLAGVPPTFVFGGRLIALQAGIESGFVSAAFALVGAAVCLVFVAAAARATRLAPGRAAEVRERAGPLVVIGLLSLAGGAAIGFAVNTLGAPLALEVMRSPLSTTSGFGIVTNSGAWQAFALAVPAAVLLALLVLTNRPPRTSIRRPMVAPRPLFELRPLHFDVRLPGVRPAPPGGELQLRAALTRPSLVFSAFLVALLAFVASRW